MPITAAFTITAFAALVFNVWFLLRAIERRKLLSTENINGELHLIADTFVRMWSVRVTSDMLMLTAGVGLLLEMRPLGYLLAAVPIASTIMGVLAIRGLLNK